jgi:hypothetical protein
MGSTSEDPLMDEGAEEIADRLESKKEIKGKGGNPLVMGMNFIVPTRMLPKIFECELH